MRRRAAVLISGRGSNMAALLAAAQTPDYPAEIVLVLSNRPDAGGLDVAAAAASRPPRSIIARFGRDRAAHEARDRGGARRGAGSNSSASPATCGC